LIYRQKIFHKGYQTKNRLLFVVLSNNKLNDKRTAHEYIGGFNRYINKMDKNLYPKNIRVITMNEFLSLFDIKGDSLSNFNYMNKLKLEALSTNPRVATDAFDALASMHRLAKTTLDLLKTSPDPASVLRAKQSLLLNYLSDPDSKTS